MKDHDWHRSSGTAYLLPVSFSVRTGRPNYTAFDISRVLRPVDDRGRTTRHMCERSYRSFRLALDRVWTQKCGPLDAFFPRMMKIRDKTGKSEPAPRVVWSAITYAANKTDALIDFGNFIEKIEALAVADPRMCAREAREQHGRRVPGQLGLTLHTIDTWAEPVSFLYPMTLKVTPPDDRPQWNRLEQALFTEAGRLHLRPISKPRASVDEMPASMELLVPGNSHEEAQKSASIFAQLLINRGIAGRLVKEFRARTETFVSDEPWPAIEAEPTNFAPVVQKANEALADLNWSLRHSP